MNFHAPPHVLAATEGVILKKAANAHPKLKRGQVWCSTCKRTQYVSTNACMKHGWPRCCGQTMTIDAPSERT